MTTIYRTYEAPFENRCFTESQMKEVYRDLADKTEYQTFDIWLLDMIKSGVFEVINAKKIYNHFFERINSNWDLSTNVCEALDKYLNQSTEELLTDEQYNTLCDEVETLICNELNKRFDESL